jgi:hypothetical protein
MQYINKQFAKSLLDYKAQHHDDLLLCMPNIDKTRKFDWPLTTDQNQFLLTSA